MEQVYVGNSVSSHDEANTPPHFNPEKFLIIFLGLTLLVLIVTNVFLFASQRQKTASKPEPTLTELLPTSSFTFPASPTPAPPTGITSKNNTQTFPVKDKNSKKVFLLIFDPVLSSGQKLTDYMKWNAPLDLVSRTISFLKEVSHNKASYEVVEQVEITKGFLKKADGFTYSESEYLAVINNTQAHHNPDEVEYLAIINNPSYNICSKFNNGVIDEVWLMSGPWFGFYESRLAGKDSFYYNSSPLLGTICNKPLPIMGFSYERDYVEMVHDFGHRTEATMTYVYGSWNQNRMSNNFDTFGLDKAQSPSFSTYGCGSIHFPPNSTRASDEYRYDSENSVPSYCDSFYSYPNLTDPLPSTATSCKAWDCTTIGYFEWWLEHIPYFSGRGPDGKLKDWWEYILNPYKAVEDKNAS